MTDWIGSLRVVERSSRRVVLRTSRTTRVYGWLLLAVGLTLAPSAWAVVPWAALVPAGIGLAGMLLATLERRLVFDQEAGTLVQAQRIAGVASSSETPLFHLRAVVVVAQPTRNGRNKYVAFVDRRVGDPIYLDEARRVARLMKMAEAIADVAEVRLEYNAAASDG